MSTVSVLRRPGVISLAILGVVFAGCSKDGSNRYPVSGTVQIGSEPIRGGFVIIEPSADNSNGGQQGYAPIRNGRFDTKDGGQPAVAGPVVVRIQGWGMPTKRFPQGVPVCAGYETRMELQPGPNDLELKVPESARVKEPREGWGDPP